MYQQYLETEKQAKTVQMQQQQQKEQRSRMPEECRKILEEGQEYITYIHNVMTIFREKRSPEN